MRHALLICLALSVCARPARAQTRIYVTGEVFADITQFSRTTTPTPQLFGAETGPRDGVTAGGGGRVGAFFSPQWSLEVGLDVGRRFEDEQSRGIRQPVGPSLPSSALLYQSRSSHQFSASSVLLGYHPPGRGRIHPGFRGGVSFMHAERSFTLASVATTLTFGSDPRGFDQLVPTISIQTDQTTAFTNGLTGTVGAEAAIDLWGRFAVVPEVRAHAGGIGGFLIRPGVAVRWRW